MPMKSKIDYKEITKLIDLLEERNLSEFELEVEGIKIRIARAKPSPPLSKAAGVSAEIPGLGAIPAPVENLGDEKENSLHIVTSPMVGTFYRAPDPSSPPFVEPGETVKKNQTLCIIEAMKLMNEIESDIEAVVEEIFVQNGKPIEYGQKLFALKPL